MIKEIAHALLPTEYGDFVIYGFEDKERKEEIVVLTAGDMQSKDSLLIRIHSKCLTWDAFHSLKCDCCSQLDYALQQIGKQWGMLIYLDQEGRGIGILNKIKAYSLQDKGYDTVEANEELWLPVDDRNYESVKEVLKYFHVWSVRLLTNNPLKLQALKDCGIQVEREVILLPENKHNEWYLKIKKAKMSHLL